LYKSIIDFLVDTNIVWRKQSECRREQEWVARAK
jgi:hypothetical protein